MKYEHLILRISYLVSIVVMIGALGWTIMFLYNNFYQALEQSSEVLALRSIVSAETLNIKRWDEVTAALKTKQESPLTLPSSDPFEQK